MHQKTVLDNGLRLLTMTMPHTRSASVCFFIGVGSRFETDDHAGMTHFVEHLCFKGTDKRPTSNAVSAPIEGVGGIINGGTDKEFTVYWSKVPQPHYCLALDTLVDMLLHSRFIPEDVERERGIIIEEIHMTKDSPSQQANILVDELLWPCHPLGRNVAGSRESMSAIDRGMLLNYLSSHYLPGNTVVSIAGNISHEEAVTTVSEAVKGWGNRKPDRYFQPYKEQPNPRLKIETRETEQTHICLGLPGLPLLTPKRFVLDLLNVILGEGMSSRLFTEIRDNLGLAYSISSYADHFLDAGSLIVYAGVERKNLQVTIEAVLEQLALLKEPIPEAEIYKAKELAKGRLLLRMEDTSNVTSWLGGQEILTGRVLTLDEVVAIIDAITAEQLRDLARELCVGEKLRLAVVGPVPQDEPLGDLLRL